MVTVDVGPEVVVLVGLQVKRPFTTHRQRVDVGDAALLGFTQRDVDAVVLEAVRHSIDVWLDDAAGGEAQQIEVETEPLAPKQEHPLVVTALAPLHPTKPLTRLLGLLRWREVLTALAEFPVTPEQKEAHDQRVMTLTSSRPMASWASKSWSQ